MTLDWAMIADSVQIRQGLAFVLGGGIDTVEASELPAGFAGSILVRLLLHRTEIDRQHTVELRVLDEDGTQLLGLHSHVHAHPPEDLPLGWDVAVMVTFPLAGLSLPRASRYSVEILGDGSHLKSLNLRVRPLPQPPPD